MARILLLLLVACGSVKDAAGDVGVGLEPLCGAIGLTCGTVFMCDGTAPDGSAWSAELCWVDDSSTELVSSLTDLGYGGTKCWPTPRGGSLGWPCIYSCTPHRGCNAYNGCWCP